MLLCGCYGACSLGRWWVLVCELDGRVGGLLVCELAGCSGACSFGCWWMLFCELDGWVLGACSLGCWWMLFCFSSWPGARGMQFGVLVDAALRA